MRNVGTRILSLTIAGWSDELRGPGRIDRDKHRRQRHHRRARCQPWRSGHGLPARPGLGCKGNANAATAQDDLTTAYNQAAGRTPVTRVATQLGGQVLTAGVYDSATGTFQITGKATLDAEGDDEAVFIFLTDSTLITGTVAVKNGADACRVFWKVGSSATLGTQTTFRGTILALTSITLNTGAEPTEQPTPEPTTEPTDQPTAQPNPTDQPRPHLRSGHPRTPAATPAPRSHVAVLPAVKKPVATRIVIRAKRIDLPVISGARIVPDQGPDRYPACDVAMWHTSFGQPGQPLTTYLYAHARAGMFLPLLTASERNNGKSLLGVLVKVYTSDARVHRYRITRVKRHATGFALVDNAPRGTQQLILQTSEGPSGTIPKLQVLAKPIGIRKSTAAEARPRANPRPCYGE